MNEHDVRQLSITVQDLTDTPRQHAALTRELAATLDRQQGITASLIDIEAQPGMRGPEVLFGNIALQLIASGGVAVTLINVLQSYFQRKPLLEIEITRKDGTAFKIHAENMREEPLQDFLEKLSQFIDH